MNVLSAPPSRRANGSRTGDPSPPSAPNPFIPPGEGIFAEGNRIDVDVP